MQRIKGTFPAHPSVPIHGPGSYILCCVLSQVWLLATTWTVTTRLYQVGCHFLFKGIISDPGMNLCFLESFTGRCIVYNWAIRKLRHRNWSRWFQIGWGAAAHSWRHEIGIGGAWKQHFNRMERKISYYNSYMCACVHESMCVCLHMYLHKALY